MSAKDALSALEERRIKMEQFSDQLFDRDYMIWDNFISDNLVTTLNQKAKQLIEQEKFRKAGIGASYMKQIKEDTRGDYIHWIDPSEATEPIQSFVKEIDFFIRFLNNRCYAGVRDFEMHFAFYPVGTRYAKHIDQLKINGQRLFSVVCYLNKNWSERDGGALRLYLKDQCVDVEPLAGRLVVFKSHLIPHEVLVTHNERIALTGWLLNQPKTLTFV